MLRTLLCFAVLFSFISVNANRITGVVKDDKGNILPYASILVKGTTLGTTANNEGRYFLDLSPGNYTIIAQYVGYNRQEKQIRVEKDTEELNFTLSLQQLTLKEVVVRPGAEDPAYEIIRNAIKKREYYLNQLDRFQCEVYIKGQFRLRDFPKRFLGQDIDFEDGDTSKKKMIYLSETVARYSVQKPNRTKIEVLSTKVSGQSDGFGFSAPQIVSFYENNIEMGRGLNPRGFVSPIANGALGFYRYKYEGSFFEDGKEINRIKVIPRRKYEPLFSGYIQITEGDWRIHSVQLQLTKQSQMEFVDTLRIDQLYVPYDQDVWVIKSQVIYPAVKMFGFDGYGSFVNVYSKFSVNPPLEKKFFGNTYLKFYEGSNKKPSEYWDSIRPVPLQLEEVYDYRKKDSLEQARKDPRYLDSLDRKRNKVTVMKLLLFGQNISKEKKRVNINVTPVIESVGYNTVEGWFLNLRGSWFKRLDTVRSRRSIGVFPNIRYGFANQHWNASAVVNYNFGKKYFNSISISGGKRVYQFNNQNPITSFDNTITTLFFERNYMKLYEAWFGRAAYTKGIGEGFTVTASLQYQDRLPLENSSDYKFRDFGNKFFTPNYPVEIMSENFARHQALIGTIGINWRPGSRYIEFPDRIVNIGSRYPTFSLSYTHGFNNILGSDIDFSKWRFGINDNLNLKLGGTFQYNISIGGFLRRDSVAVPDYKHFNGNQIILASDYLNSFQFLPYYKYSNTSNFFAEAHAEHHFNGLLTNKIPFFRSLNWHLVGGANTFYLNKDSYYVEPFIGLENILKVIRIDFLWGFFKGEKAAMGVRIGIRGKSSGGSGD